MLYSVDSRNQTADTRRITLGSYQRWFIAVYHHVIINGYHNTIGILRPLTSQSMATGESLQGEGVLGGNIQCLTPPAGVLPYIDVVEEALCFGWIDSTLKKLPDGRLAQRLSPRRKKSHWTELNKQRCQDLEKRGLMTPAGIEALYRH